MTTGTTSKAQISHVETSHGPSGAHKATLRAAEVNRAQVIKWKVAFLIVITSTRRVFELAALSTKGDLDTF